MNEFKVKYAGQKIIKYYERIDHKIVKSFKPVILLDSNKDKITIDYYNKFLKLGELKIDEELIIKTKKDKFESIRYKNIYRIERVNKNSEYKKMPTDVGLMGKMISKDFYKFDFISLDNRLYYKKLYYSWLNKQNDQRRLDNQKVTTLKFNKDNEESKEVA